MKLFNNPEIKKFIMLTVLIALIFSCVALFFSYEASICSFAVSSVLIFCFLFFTRNRYKRLDELSEKIGKILHGDDSTVIKALSEGELSILESDVQKMLIRLREQKDILEKEKNFLADSIADISHQIRTPLTSINLILSLLMSGNLSDERRSELLMELTSLISRTENLVTTLLKISKIDAGTVNFEMKEFYFADIVNAACEPLGIAMDIKNQSLEIYCDDIIVYCDFSWFTEAIGNIIKNCTEHSPDNGTVTVRAYDTPIFTQIVISDTGSGFDDEDILHIFERFYKGKNSAADSFGIGLNLSAMIISSHNGTIKAQNNSNGGAEFVIKLYKQVL